MRVVLQKIRWRVLHAAAWLTKGKWLVASKWLSFVTAALMLLAERRCLRELASPRHSLTIRSAVLRRSLRNYGQVLILNAYDVFPLDNRGDRELPWWRPSAVVRCSVGRC